MIALTLHTHSHTVCLANKALSSFLYQIIIIFHNQPRVVSHMFRHYVAEPAAAEYKLQAHIKKEEKKIIRDLSYLYLSDTPSAVILFMISDIFSFIDSSNI